MTSPGRFNYQFFNSCEDFTSKQLHSLGAVDKASEVIDKELRKGLFSLLRCGANNGRAEARRIVALMSPVGDGSANPIVNISGFHAFLQAHSAIENFWC